MMTQFVIKTLTCQTSVTQIYIIAIFPMSSTSELSDITDNYFKILLVIYSLLRN